MAPYQRRRYYNRRKWRKSYRRFPFRRWRPATTFRFRKRRRRRKVNFRKFKKRYKKLRNIKLKQWQPTSIKKCHIKGYLCLFQFGDGRQENNYACYKESFVPEHHPGGGGWSIQQLSLGTLFTINNEQLQNYWTKSNYRLNLCRYIGCTITAYRQPYVDYILHYFHDAPKNVSKYYYASFHPQKMLQLQNKIIVPSYNSMPHKRKSYIRIHIPPPKLMKNHWFFQAKLASFPLIHLAATSISLTNMFGSDKAQNNNATFLTLNTSFFQNPYVQIQDPKTSAYGYHPNRDNYLWAAYKAESPIDNYKREISIYLGNSLENIPGFPEKQNTWNTPQGWGNPFHWEYLTGTTITYITRATEDPKQWLQNSTLTSNIGSNRERTTPSVISVRYNPYKDKGKGNQIYFIPNNKPSHTSWEPTQDTDIHFQDFPLWIMLWGIEDIIQKMGKCPNLYENWIMVIKSSYFNEKETYFVPLSYNFVHGIGPYETDRADNPPSLHTKWFPKYAFQKEAIHDLIMTAPAVCRPDHTKNMQALIKYNFLFKWGGNISPMENVYDPNSQPITPTPDNFILLNEITDPETNPETFIYPWDVRHDFLTAKATERIKESSTDDYSLFTDGKQNTTDVQLFPQETQTKKTPKTQAQTLLLQLKQLQQYNKQLQQRFNRLNISLEDL